MWNPGTEWYDSIRTIEVVTLVIIWERVYMVEQSENLNFAVIEQISKNKILYKVNVPNKLVNIWSNMGSNKNKFGMI